jgi:hypothetical protein
MLLMAYNVFRTVRASTRLKPKPPPRSPLWEPTDEA